MQCWAWLTREGQTETEKVLNKHLSVSGEKKGVQWYKSIRCSSGEVKKDDVVRAKFPYVFFFLNFKSCFSVISFVLLIKEVFQTFFYTIKQ